MDDDQMAVFAFFRNEEDVKRALITLKTEGIPESDIKVMYPESRGNQDFAYILRTKVKRGALLGGVIGAVIGFVAALLLPFFTSFGRTAADPGASDWRLNLLAILVLTPLAGLGGMAWGTLIGIGTPGTAEERYKLYSQSGGVLLSVQQSGSRENVEHISDLLGRMGGQEIHLVNEQKTWSRISEDWNRIDRWPSP